MKMPDKPIAIVYWQDAIYSCLRYYNKYKERVPMSSITVGFLIEYDNEKALLYSDYFDGEYRNEMMIPSGMIQKVEIVDFT